MSYLEHLNPAQKEAVQHTEGPLLVLAGAGAGKTRVIVHRILHLIHSGVDPRRILAVTFTNKAAKEMRERVEEHLKNMQAHPGGTPVLATFHGLGVRILKEKGSLLGIQKQFSIFDRSDSTKIVRNALVALGYDPKQYEPRQILSTISKQKGDGVSLFEYESGANNPYAKAVALVWQRYQKKLKEEQALDFDDLLVRTVDLLKEHPEVREYYQSLFQYIHIDEYQDTNQIQYQLIKLLINEKKNICVVGDVDQNIYSWRGASIENILRFEKDFPNGKAVMLEQNYRSTKTIVAISNAVIEKNVRRPEKNLFTENEEGEKPFLYAAYDEHDEARFIVEKAQELKEQGVPYEQMSVLYRTNFQSRVLEDTFVYYDVPYRLIGTKFFDRKEIKDALSYLRAALNPESTTDVTRVINTPARGIGKVTLLRVIEKKFDKLTPAVQKKVEGFFALLKDFRVHIEKEKASSVMKFVIQQSGLEKFYKERGTEEDLERLENLYELVTLAARYDKLPAPEGVEKLLEEAALATDQDEMDQKNKGGVTLMTVHAAKGLEFDYVFISGLEEGLFPHDRVDDDAHDDEEERRLFYVALTRARKRLFLSFASSRMIYGSRQINVPSDFINDIDASMLEMNEEDSLEGKTVYLE